MCNFGAVFLNVLPQLLQGPLTATLTVLLFVTMAWPSAQMKLHSKLRITFVMAVAFTAEHADSMILSAMYLGIGGPLYHLSIRGQHALH